MRSEPAWQIGPFTPRGEVLRQQPHARFQCPVLGTAVPWATKDVFNPAAVVREGHVYLLLRGEDEVGPYSGTSRIGLATSDDGMAFSVEPEPVLHPANDLWQPWEWPGGCEDPRVVESPDVHRVPGQRVLRPVLAPRRGRFDSLVVEPGPPAVKTEDGIVLIYNGAHAVFDGHGVAASVAYQPGEALFDGDDFASPIALVTAPRR